MIVIIALVAKSVYLVSPPVRIVIVTRTFENLKLWTTQKMSFEKNALGLFDMYKC